MNILSKALFGSAILASALLTTSAHADFVNGSFEDPAIDAATVLAVSGTDIPGWTYTNGGAGAIISNGFVGAGTTWHETPAGKQYLYVAQNAGSGTTLDQAVDLGVGRHTLSFLQADFAGDFITPGGAIFVTVLNPDNTELVAPTQFTTVNYGDFIEQTLDFDAATTGSYNFRFTSVANHASIIDNVHIDAAVPEPASIVFVGLGFAGLLLRRRA